MVLQLLSIVNNYACPGLDGLGSSPDRRPAPFSWGISVDGRPNRRNKAAISNFSRVVRTGP